MASGLVALLDDVAAIAKMAAASLDDVTAAAGKASSKAVGVVVDDAAVTPGYAMGFTPERELPIVLKIAIGSLKNKFFFLLPGALLLSAFAPWAVTPILMLGGCYLSFEAVEKLVEVFSPEDDTPQADELALSSAELEARQVKGAIRTDLILSGEIMAISLANVAEQPLWVQAMALVIVSIAITAGVYGVVGLIVKMDDIGLHMAARKAKLTQAIGRSLVKGMPAVLGLLASVGTAAMLWVGGGILVHGLHEFHFTPIPAWVEAASHWAGQVPGIGAVTGWAVMALCSAVVGAVAGAVIVGVVHLIPHKKAAH